MNDSACKEQYLEFSETYCPPIFDGYICWPPTAPGNLTYAACPENLPGTIKGRAYRNCTINGTWETKESVNRTKGYTHFNECFLPQLESIMKMCNRIEECQQIFRNTRIIEMVGLALSLVSLMISLTIFFRYRILKNNRTKIHKNLFIATILQVIFRLIIYVNQLLDTEDKFLKVWYLTEIVYSLQEYTKTAMFVWMFIEGLYLHNVITVTIFQEHSYIKYYFYLGWIVPALMTVAWVWTMLKMGDSWEFYFFLPYYWILEAPRSFIIMMNMMFLISIIRVLIVKLRESHTSEIEQVRKAVRAAIFLLPLMGITNVCFWIVPWTDFQEAWQLALWAYPSYFLNTFQGFFVAVLYCFLNGEVQTAIKNSYYLHMSWRNHDYTPCRNLTVVSTAAEPEGALTNGDNSNWIRNCLKNFNNKSAEDKEIEVFDFNGRRKSAIVSPITMVETKLCPSEKKPVWPRLSNEDTDTTLTDDKNSESKV